MFLRIANKLRRRVKTHRLTVEHRRDKHIRVMAFELGRRIDQVGKARGVAFRKAVTAKSFNLLPAILGKFRGVSICLHSFEKLLAVCRSFLPA